MYKGILRRGDINPKNSPIEYGNGHKYLATILKVKIMKYNNSQNHSISVYLIFTTSLRIHFY